MKWSVKNGTWLKRGFGTVGLSWPSLAFMSILNSGNKIQKNEWVKGNQDQDYPIVREFAEWSFEFALLSIENGIQQPIRLMY